MASSYTVRINDHEFLSESVMDEKSVVYFRHSERLSKKTHSLSCALADVDLEALAALGRDTDGFLKHELRGPAWLALLKSRLPFDTASSSKNGGGDPHRDEHQVALDVKRSFGDIKDDNAKAFLRHALERTIVRVLRAFPQLSYYQGYHDVCAVFVLVFVHASAPGVGHNLSASTSSTASAEGMDAPHDSDGSDISESLSSSSISTKLADDSLLLVDSEQLFEAVVIFTLLYLRDFMMNSLTFTIDQLALIPLIVKQKDSYFYRTFQLDKIDPFFALSSILTLFSHDLRPQSDDAPSIVFQVFDLVISANSMMVPLVAYSYLLLAKKDDLLLRYKENIDNFDNSTDLIHGVIQQEMIAGSSVQLWNDILDASRNSSLELPRESKKILNKYSVLLTNSRGPVLLEEVLTWLSREICLNESVGSRNAGLDNKKSPVPKWRLLAQGRGSILVKFSLFIGVAAILLKLYIQSLEGHQGHRRIELYFDQIKSLKFLGLTQPRRVWLDPLKTLLKIGRT